MGMSSDKQFRLMAAAVYEIRQLLSLYLGSECDADDSVRLAAHLSYALHNDALAILEGGGEFDVEAAIQRIKRAEFIVGKEFADATGDLRAREIAQPDEGGA